MIKGKGEKRGRLPGARDILLPKRSETMGQERTENERGVGGSQTSAERTPRRKSQHREPVKRRENVIGGTSEVGVRHKNRSLPIQEKRNGRTED